METNKLIVLHKIKVMNEQQLQDKLAIVKENISLLVDYYNQNNIMDTIPDDAWEYILAIEEACK